MKSRYNISTFVFGAVVVIFFMLSLFGFGDSVHASGTTVCPTDENTYIVIVRRDSSKSPETTKESPFFPAEPHDHFCVPDKEWKILELVNADFAIAKSGLKQRIECEVLGNEDFKGDPGWDEVEEYKDLDAKVKFEKHMQVVCYEGKKTGEEKYIAKVRYEIGQNYYYSYGTPNSFVTSDEFKSKYGGDDRKGGIKFFDPNYIQKPAGAPADQLAGAQFVCSSEKNIGKCKEHTGCVPFDSKCQELKTMSVEDKQKYMSEQASEQLSKNYGTPEGYVGPLPPCAFKGTCDNINDLLELLINFAKGFFGLVGIFAFAFFVYGGFLMITSFGQEDRITQGKKTLVSAVLGIIIVFSAYIIVDFILDAVQVGQDFRAVGKSDQP